MARVGRIAGSLLVQNEGRFALVGYPKEPCAWREFGIETPPAFERWSSPVVPVVPCGHVELGRVILTIRDAQHDLLQALSSRLLVERNGSVSERLWRLIVEADEAGHVEPGERDATWLVEAPLSVWNLVRESVLRPLARGDA